MIHGPGEPLLWKNINEALPLFHNSTAIKSIHIVSNGKELDRIEEATWNCIDNMEISIYSGAKDIVLDNIAAEHKNKLNIIEKDTFMTRFEKNEAFDIPCICMCGGPMLIGDTIFFYCGPPVFDAAQLLGIDIYDLKYLYTTVGEEYLSDYNPSNKGNMAICRHCWANGYRFFKDKDRSVDITTSGGGWQ